MGEGGEEPRFVFRLPSWLNPGREERNFGGEREF